MGACLRLRKKIQSQRCNKSGRHIGQTKSAKFGACLIQGSGLAQSRLLGKDIFRFLFDDQSRIFGPSTSRPQMTKDMLFSQGARRMRGNERATSGADWSFRRCDPVTTAELICPLKNFSFWTRIRPSFRDAGCQHTTSPWPPWTIFSKFRHLEVAAATTSDNHALYT